MLYHLGAQLNQQLRQLLKANIIQLTISMINEILNKKTGNWIFILQSLLIGILIEFWSK